MDPMITAKTTTNERSLNLIKPTIPVIKAAIPETDAHVPTMMSYGLPALYPAK